MGVILIKIFYTIFQKYVYLVALVAVTLTVHTVYDIDESENIALQDRQIQSFIIRTLDNSIYFQSSNEQYCKFLEMYSSSFAITSEVSEKEIVLDRYTALLEFTNTNGENYSVYVQLSEPLDHTSENKFVDLLENVAPTLMSVDSDNNTYLYQDTMSKEFKKLISEFKNS